MDAAIEVRDLVARYGDRVILRNISCDIQRGKVTVILGGSGCGKSTFLKHLIGLLKPASGKILINGAETTVMTEDEFNEVRKRIGILFQGAALLNSITVGENVALPIREHTRIEEPTIKIMVRMKLDHVDLAGFEDYYPSQLSGGMKKRAGIARAIALDPELLFFDEPSAGLDPITAAGLDQLILKLKNVFKMTIVVVTHELSSILKIADQAMMLHQGELIFSGTLPEMQAADHPRVRMFLERRPEEGTSSPEDFFKFLAGN
jgi:phospholipid/cholesterol/gamma-HCH transport system ATP-binding protein